VAAKEMCRGPDGTSNDTTEAVVVRGWNVVGTVVEFGVLLGVSA
jgi:hypothetical protein